MGTGDLPPRELSLEIKMQGMEHLLIKVKNYLFLDLNQNQFSHYRFQYQNQSKIDG